MKKIGEQEETKIAYNCKKATFLIEKQQIGKITLKEKLELELHLKGCEICNLFMKQSALINKFVKKLVVPEQQEVKLDEKLKAQMQRQIDQKLDGK